MNRAVDLSQVLDEGVIPTTLYTPTRPKEDWDDFYILDIFLNGTDDFEIARLEVETKGEAVLAAKGLKKGLWYEITKTTLCRACDSYDCEHALQKAAKWVSNPKARLGRRTQVE